MKDGAGGALERRNSPTRLRSSLMLRMGWVMAPEIQIAMATPTARKMTLTTRVSRVARWIGPLTSSTGIITVRNHGRSPPTSKARTFVITASEPTDGLNFRGATDDALGLCEILSAASFRAVVITGGKEPPPSTTR